MPAAHRFVLGLALALAAWLAAVPAQAQAFNERLCPASHPDPVFLGGSQAPTACYESCRPDFTGLAGRCVQARCPDGLADWGGACVAQSAPSCKPGQESWFGFCMNSCRAGLVPSGPTCVETRPAGWNDGGGIWWRWGSRRVCTWWGHCYNVPQFEQRGKVVEARPRSAASCPAGQQLWGNTCLQINAKASYGRGSTTQLPVVATDSFVRTPVSQAAERFSVAVVSDTQLPWDESAATGAQSRASRDALWRNARRYNQELVQSVNGLNASLADGGQPLAFTVMNGDLTAFFHPEQYSEFRAFYDAGFKWAYPTALQTPVYLGLGNHDYENNVGDCRAMSVDANRCTKNAINLIRGSVFLGYTQNMPAQTIESYDAASLAYAWNHGEFHFVQLHNGPGYRIGALGIGPSYTWLKATLERAKARGQAVIINLHKPEEAQKPEFLQAIDGQPVAAVFAGHLHQSAGLLANLTTPSQRRIPLFLSGSADSQTFLKVDFEGSGAARQLRVTVMGTAGGQAQPKGQPVTVAAGN